MTVELETPALGFSSFHLKPNTRDHDAAWGARLMYDEVKAGGAGVVYNRQGAWGSKEDLEGKVFPAVERFAKVLTYLAKHSYTMKSDSVDRWVWHDPLEDVIIVASPQASYGYLYITAALEKVGGVTRLEPLAEKSWGKEPREHVLDMIAGCDFFDAERHSLNEQMEWHRQHGYRGNRDLKARLKALEAAFLG